MTTILKYIWAVPHLLLTLFSFFSGFSYAFLLPLFLISISETPTALYLSIAFALSPLYIVLSLYLFEESSDEMIDIGYSMIGVLLGVAVFVSLFGLIVEKFIELA